MADWSNSPEGTEHDIPHHELDSTNATISIYAPAVYGNTSTMDQLKRMLKNQYPSINVVEDAEHKYNVILVHYYRDEDDEIDGDDVVEIVKSLDGNARFHNN